MRQYNKHLFASSSYSMGSQTESARYMSSGKAGIRKGKDTLDLMGMSGSKVILPTEGDMKRAEKLIQITVPNSVKRHRSDREFGVV